MYTQLDQATHINYKLWIHRCLCVIWICIGVVTLVLLILADSGYFRSEQYVSGCECYEFDVWELNNNKTLCCTHDLFPVNCRPLINYNKVFIDTWVQPYLLSMTIILCVCGAGLIVYDIHTSANPSRNTRHPLLCSLIVILGVTIAMYSATTLPQKDFLKCLSK